MAKRSVRYCHTNHLLWAAGCTQDDEEHQQTDSNEPEVELGVDSSANEDAEAASEPAIVSVPCSCNAQPTYHYVWGWLPILWLTDYDCFGLKCIWYCTCDTKQQDMSQ